MAYESWTNSADSEKIKNLAAVLTGGSIVMAICYSILNYEHNYIKFKHEVESAKELLTFNTATKMHEIEMIKHFRNIRTFYNEKKALFLENKLKEVDDIIRNNLDLRVSYVAIFNYLECISIGVEQCIMDEQFLKDFFKTIFINYYLDFNSYIEYERKEYNSPRTFRSFTNLAKKWEEEI